jgi:hypothetical protein
VKIAKTESGAHYANLPGLAELVDAYEQICQSVQPRLPRKPRPPRQPTGWPASPRFARIVDKHPIAGPRRRGRWPHRYTLTASPSLSGVRPRR